MGKAPYVILFEVRKAAIKTLFEAKNSPHGQVRADGYFL